MNQNIIKTTKIIYVTALFLGLVNLVASNVLATQGQELSSLNNEAIELQKENQYIKNTISKQTSLAELEKWADENGFVKVSDPIALTTPAPVALAN